MREPQPPAELNENESDGLGDWETVLTNRADVESAGRSCMAIVVMLAVILALLLVWVTLHALGMVS